MKKRLFAIIAMLLSLCLLCGCGCGFISQRINVLNHMFHSGALTGGAEPSQADKQVSCFDDIVYTRPELSEIEACAEAVTEAIEKDRYSGVTSALDRFYELYYSFDTMYTVADIRACQDTSDEFYAEEFSWCDENYYNLQQTMEEVLSACAVSDMGRKLERDYFWQGFCDEYGEDSESVYYDETVELMQEESALLAEYRAAAADNTMEVDGRETDYQEYIFSLDGDEYDAADRSYYEQKSNKLAEIYIKLVDVRNRLAAELGYDSYEQMQYYYYFERDYSPEEARAYMNDVKKFMVPLYRKVQAKDLYSGVDYGYISEPELYDTLQAAVTDMGGEIEKSFRHMSDMGMYDISFDEDKVDMSFQTYLEDYNTPFLFLSPYQDLTDILTFAHEFGHFTDAWINENAYETIDLSESYSQAMEYLAVLHLKDYLPEREYENLMRIKMLDTLELYIQQVSFAEFESRVYAMGAENLSADVLNRLSLELAQEYGYCEEGYEYYYAMSWIDIPHFFEMPFYVITYPVSNDISMQIFELEMEKEGQGIDKFNELLPRTSYGLIETAEEGGLESPFAPGRIRMVSADIERQLLH